MIQSIHDYKSTPITFQLIPLSNALYVYISSTGAFHNLTMAVSHTLSTQPGNHVCTSIVLNNKMGMDEVGERLAHRLAKRHNAKYRQILVSCEIPQEHGFLDFVEHKLMDLMQQLNSTLPAQDTCSIDKESIQIN